MISNIIENEMSRKAIWFKMILGPSRNILAITASVVQLYSTVPDSSNVTFNPAFS